MDLRAKINSYFPSLTKTEQRVAQSVLDQSENLLFHSITELAEFSGVGETSVIRFCRKIGFKGYQEFRLALAQDQTYQKLSEPTNEENTEDYTQDVFNHANNVLKMSLSLLDRNKLDQAIEVIDKARRILFVGVGASGITCLDAKNRFLRIGRLSDAVSDSHIQAMMAVYLGPEDVAIGFSISGSTIDTNDALLKAKQNGAKVIAVTNYAKSPITGIADIVLLTAGKESPLEGGSMTAKMSQLLMIDFICEGLSRRDKEYTKTMKEKTARAVVDRNH